jgi:hypothetical protein
MKNLVVMALVMGSHLALAQNEYVVTLQSDTLRGEVSMANYGSSPIQQIMLRIDGKKKVYKVNEVKAFQMKGDTYHTVRDYEGYKFMKLMQGGYLSSYLYCLPGKEDFSQPLLVKVDGGIMGVPTFNFKKKMGDFLRDAPELVDRIEAGDLARKDLEVIVLEYNKQIASRSKTTPLAKAEITTLELSSDLSGDMDRLRLQIAKSKLGKKADLLEMINDMEERLQRGEKIPGFISNALLDYSQDDEDVQANLKDFLEKVR